MEGMDELREENAWLQETISKLQRQAAAHETQLRQKTEEAESMRKVAEAVREAGARLRVAELERQRREEEEAERLRARLKTRWEGAERGWEGLVG